MDTELDSETHVQATRITIINESSYGGTGRHSGLRLRVFYIRPGSSPGRSIEKEECVKNILIYQMGRVGSISLVNAFREHGIYVDHVHNILDPYGEYVIAGKRKKFFKLLNEEPWRIITIVRDPVMRNISALIYGLTPDEVMHGNFETWKNMLLKYDRAPALSWVDREVGALLGLDFKDFSRSKGWTIYYPGMDPLATNNHTLLVLRTEDLSKASTTEALMRFTGIPGISVNGNANSASYTWYEDFKKYLVGKLPSYFLFDNYMQSYAPLFYTKKELNKMWNRWL